MRILFALFFLCFTVNGQRVINSYQFVESDPIASIPSLVSYFDAETLVGSDGATFTSISDSHTGGNVLNSDGGSDPTINIASDGAREMQFNGTNQKLQEPTNASNIDFDPSVDSFTLIVVMGEIAPTQYSQVVSKCGLNNSIDGEFGIRMDTPGPSAESFVGAADASTSGNTVAARDIYILTSTPGTNGANFYINGTLIDTYTPGANADPNELTVASRDGAGSEWMDGSIRKIAICNDVISAGDISAIQDVFGL